MRDSDRDGGRAVHDEDRPSLAPRRPEGDDAAAAAVLLQGCLDRRAGERSLTRRAAVSWRCCCCSALLARRAARAALARRQHLRATAARARRRRRVRSQTVKLVVPEGFAIRDIARRVPTIGISRSTYRPPCRARSRPPGYQATGKERLGMEGFLFPATYELAQAAVGATMLVAEQLEAFERARRAGRLQLREEART